ncbi:MFS general substrate transporter [Fomes fomentarius]|nr:MFS general substrate transporter [Fomes fomentarius]
MDTESKDKDEASVHVSPTDVEDGNSNSSPIDEAQLVRRIDCRVLPVLFVFYILTFLDRINISNAVLLGLREDLGLSGTEFNTVLVIFYVPCVLFEIPSNMLLKRLKPHAWMSFCVALFGLVTILQGFTQDFGGLVATRFFLGLAEAGALPASYYILAMWYKRAEAQKRYSFIFSGSALAGAFGGLLASAIGQMDGIQGYRGWRWVFILEGALTVVASVILFFTISDFPEEAAWLSQEEKEIVKARLYAEVGPSRRHDQLTLKHVLEVLKDWKIIVAGFMYLGCNTAGYCYAYFAPTIIQTLGYSPIRTQLLSAPPWACSFVLAMLTATLSDRLRRRFVFIIVSLTVALAGFTILLVVHDRTHLQYGALYLASAGYVTAMPIVLCWPNMNLTGHHRRAVGVAFQLGFASNGAIIAAFAFLAKDAPNYIPGYSVAIAFILVALISSTIYYLGLSWENARRDRMQTEGIGAALSEDEKKQMGDLNPDYRYFT